MSARWEIRSVPAEGYEKDLGEALADGWEPFSVTAELATAYTRHLVWLRRWVLTPEPEDNEAILTELLVKPLPRRG